jgi:hypothetical protein
MQNACLNLKLKAVAKRGCNLIEQSKQSLLSPSVAVDGSAVGIGDGGR